MNARPHLFGVVGAEYLHDDIATVVDGLDPAIYPDRVEVEEFTQETDAQLVARITPADCIIDHLVENFLDDYAADVEPPSPFAGDPTKDPALLGLAELLRQALARRVTWRWADQRVATHVVTWDGDEPLVDGERLYVRREVVS